MSELQHPSTSPSAAGGADSITLIIDYGNGARKRFDRIAWRQDMAVLDVLDAANAISPGVQFVFAPTFSDRAGREVGSVTTIDGVAAADDRHWLLWINEGYQGSQLRQRGGYAAFGLPRVQPGDAVLLTLAAAPA